MQWQFGVYFKGNVVDMVHLTCDILAKLGYVSIAIIKNVIIGMVTGTKGAEIEDPNKS